MSNLRPFNNIYSIFDNFFNDSFFNSGFSKLSNYSIQHINDDLYSIKINAAGFKKNEIEITVENNVLYVCGKSTQQNSNNYIHNGLRYEFTNQFSIAEGAQIKDATLTDGILTIDVYNPKQLPNKGKKVPIR